MRRFKGIFRTIRYLAVFSVCILTSSVFAAKRECTKVLADLGQYKIFVSGAGDWHVAAKKDGDKVSVLYEGHGESGALNAILKDLGFDIKREDREMDSGTYEPKATDWQANKPARGKKAKGDGAPTDEAGEKTSGRIFIPIEPDELKTKIDAAWKEWTPEGEEPDRYAIKELTAAIARDLKKVQFDLENTNWNDPFNGAPPVGYHKLSNGLSYFGVIAGGDWESPLFFIIYWDGKQLRGYIPKDGNPWNTDTKQAYGNDEEADAANIKKRYKDDLKEVPADQLDDAIQRLLSHGFPFDAQKIIADIEKRIVRGSP